MSTILAASIACQESRLGTTAGKGHYSPNVRVDGLGATCPPLGFSSQGLHQQSKGMLNFLSEDKTVYCTKLLLAREEQDAETIR